MRSLKQSVNLQVIKRANTARFFIVE